MNDSKIKNVYENTETFSLFIRLISKRMVIRRILWKLTDLSKDYFVWQ